MAFDTNDVQVQFLKDIHKGSTVCSSRSQPPNLEQVERRQYDVELAQNQGLRQSARSGPRKGYKR
jgi:hypothetical protein